MQGVCFFFCEIDSYSILEVWNCLQWGRSNLADPAEWPKICLLNRDFGHILSNFPRKNSKTQSSLNFLLSGPRKLTKSDFSGLAPIRRVLRGSLKEERAPQSVETPGHFSPYES